jgi:hypothetical protein
MTASLRWEYTGQCTFCDESDPFSSESPLSETPETITTARRFTFTVFVEFVRVLASLCRDA